MPYRLIVAALLGLLSANAWAFDVSKASRYASPDLFRPQMDQMIVHGSGSKIGAVANPLFSEANGQLARGVIFDSGGSLATPGVVKVPAGKQVDVMGWRETNIVAGAGSRTAWLDFDLTTSGGDPTTNLYGVIGALHNAGPGATKAIYGRVIGMPGTTGVLVGGVFGAITRSGVNTSWAIEITNDTVDGTPIDAGIILDSNAKDRTKVIPHQFGFLSTLQVSFNQAMIQGFASGPGDALRWVSGDGTKFLAKINKDGSGYFQGVAIGDFGVTIAPSSVNLPAQGNLVLPNAQRTYAWQAVNNDYLRLLIGGVGDAIQVRPQGNAVSVLIGGTVRNLQIKSQSQLTASDNVVVAVSP